MKVTNQHKPSILKYNLFTYTYCACARVCVYAWQLKQYIGIQYLWVMGMLVVFIFFFGLFFIFQIVMFITTRKSINFKMHSLKSFVLIQSYEKNKTKIKGKSLMGIATDFRNSCHICIEVTIFRYSLMTVVHLEDDENC